MKITKNSSSFLLIIATIFLLFGTATASERSFGEKPWGLGVIMRKATILFRL